MGAPSASAPEAESASPQAGIFSPVKDSPPVDEEKGVSPTDSQPPPEDSRPVEPEAEAQDASSIHSSRSQYARFTARQRTLISITISFCGFLTPISSTAVLVAIPDVAATFATSGVVINVSNACFFVFMAISPIFWGPLSQAVGRRPVFLAAGALLTAFSAGTAAAPNVAAYFAFRMLTAFQGTAYLVVGSVVIGDVYHPTERGRALGVFLSGLLVGPTVAPLLGGIVITFTSWRIIFWVITGLGALATLMTIFLLPETIPTQPDAFTGLTPFQTIRKLGRLTNPAKVIRPLLTYPNLWISALAVSSLIWNQYSLLTPIRYVLNPRFHLTTPLQSALFFLPPGAGYLAGTFVGGRWSDVIVRRYMRLHGRRIPEDRLNAAVVIMAICVPGSMLVYGWAVEAEVGGIPLVVVAMFLQGFTQLLCLPSLNTYLIDVLQDKGQSSVAVAGNYLARFLFAAAGTAVCLPAIRAIGVGWFSTISGLFISVTAALVWLLTRYGEKWRVRIGKVDDSGAEG